MSGTSDGSLQTGTTVDGRFHVTRVLGRWRIGTAYLAVDEAADVHTLLAFDLKPRVQKAYSAWIDNEAERNQGLGPDLLVPREGGVLKRRGRGWMITGPFRGTSLLQQMRGRGPLGESTAARLGERLARLVSHAHEGGVVLGGLRPTTILLDPEGNDPHRPLIFDIGLERGLPEFLRNPPPPALAYRAPERPDGGPTRPAEDVFALGALLYYMITGQKPPQIDPREGGRVATPPSWIRKDAVLAAYLDPVVLKAMAPRARDRYPSAHRVAEALSALSEVFGLSPAARELLGLPTPEPAGPFRREPTSPYLLHDFLGLPDDEDDEPTEIETLDVSLLMLDDE